MTEVSEAPSWQPAVPSAAALRAAEAALDEVAPLRGVGDALDATALGDVLIVRFASLLDGYPDWAWTVTLSTLDDEPSVLELALLPGEGALTAPAWVPWADRLADYLATKQADDVEESGGEAGSDADSDSDSDSDSDESVAESDEDFGDFDEDDLAADDVDELDTLDDDEIAEAEADATAR